MLESRSYEGANAGIALIRDGNGTRSFETLMRYRGAAMAEFMRALRTLEAFPAEQAAADLAVVAEAPVETRPGGPAGRSLADRRRGPNKPGHAAALLPEYVRPDPAGRGGPAGGLQKINADRGRNRAGGVPARPIS